MPMNISDHAPETALHEEIKQITAKMDVLLPYLDKLHDKIDALAEAKQPSEPPKNE